MQLMAAAENIRAFERAQYGVASDDEVAVAALRGRPRQRLGHGSGSGSGVSLVPEYATEGYTTGTDGFDTQELERLDSNGVTLLLLTKRRTPGSGSGSGNGTSTEAAAAAATGLSVADLEDLRGTMVVGPGHGPGPWLTYWVANELDCGIKFELSLNAVEPAEAAPQPSAPDLHPTAISNSDPAAAAAAAAAAPDPDPDPDHLPAGPPLSPNFIMPAQRVFHVRVPARSTAVALCLNALEPARDEWDYPGYSWHFEQDDQAPAVRHRSRSRSRTRNRSRNRTRPCGGVGAAGSGPGP